MSRKPKSPLSKLPPEAQTQITEWLRGKSYEDVRQLIRTTLGIETSESALARFYHSQRDPETRASLQLTASAISDLKVLRPELELVSKYPCPSDLKANCACLRCAAVRLLELLPQERHCPLCDKLFVVRRAERFCSKPCAEKFRKRL